MTADLFWQKVVDSGEAPVFLPDVGTFFNQDMAAAESLIAKVLESGVDFLKGELLHDPDICLNVDAGVNYLDPQGNAVPENYRKLIERKVVPLESYRRLFSVLDTSSVGLVFSVYDLVGADFALDMGSSALKIASANVVHAPLIRHCARSGVPLIIDTASSTLDEVERAVNWARDAGAERLVVEYSPPAPPAPLANHNLSVISRLRQLFDLPVGLSDHHHGEEALYLATALGYRILEKGISPTAHSSDQDVYHALPVDRLGAAVETCRKIFVATGSPEAAYQAPPQRRNSRMGLVAATDLQPGDRLTLDNTRFAFPTLGIEVEQWDRAQQAVVRNALAAGEVIRWTDLDA
jgi:N,N'-diacetyllegionaminate synthase